MIKGRYTPLHYSIYTDFPCFPFQLTLEIPRHLIPKLCEELQALVSERQGASFYYPNRGTDKATICRYEWHYPMHRKKFGIRLGIMLEVAEKNVEKIDAYITTSDLLRDPQTANRQLPLHLIEKMQGEIINLIGLAFSRLQTSEWREAHVIFHIEVPNLNGFSKTFYTNDQKIVVFPTLILKDQRRVSAVSVNVKASSNESSRNEAIEHLSLFCALATIANWQFYKVTTIKWSVTRPKVEFLPTLENVDLARLYPSQKRKFALEEINENVNERIDWVWKCFVGLNETDKEIFKTALYAYYACKEIISNQPTLGIVALIAALSSLTKDRQTKCLGKITCSICGEIHDFQHNIVGERAAVTSFINDTLHINDDLSKKKEVKKLLERVYNKQRSAFVHGAEFRHNEHIKGYSLPSAVPTEDAPVRDQFSYSSDLYSLELLTRRVLLGWLSEKTGNNLDANLFSLDGTSDLRIMQYPIVQNVIRLPYRRVVSTLFSRNDSQSS